MREEEGELGWSLMGVVGRLWTRWRELWRGVDNSKMIRELFDGVR